MLGFEELIEYNLKLHAISTSQEPGITATVYSVSIDYHW